jgi:hypothetical protein
MGARELEPQNVFPVDIPLCGHDEISFLRTSRVKELNSRLALLGSEPRRPPGSERSVFRGNQLSPPNRVLR